MVKKYTDADIEHYFQTLIETPNRLTDYATAMGELRLNQPLAPNEWSPTEIMGHLRGCADVWSYSIYAMLTLDGPTLAHIHPRDWAKRQGYAALSFAENLQAFKLGRDNLVRLLQTLTFEEWNRSATFFGRANTFTVFGENLRMASHEADHWDQLNAHQPSAD